jgi:hypothetical protein
MRSIVRHERIWSPYHRGKIEYFDVRIHVCHTPFRRERGWFGSASVSFQSILDPSAPYFACEACHIHAHQRTTFSRATWNPRKAFQKTRKNTFDCMHPRHYDCSVRNSLAVTERTPQHGHVLAHRFGVRVGMLVQFCLSPAMTDHQNLIQKPPQSMGLVSEG